MATVGRLKLRFTDRAESDMKAIRAYIARDRPRGAARVIARLASAARGLREFPEIGRRGSEAGTREFVVSPLPYILVYEIDEVGKTVAVLNVVHAARDRTSRET